MTNLTYQDDNEKGFSYQNRGRRKPGHTQLRPDDQEEFIRHAYFGDSDDLPVSDRAMMSSHQRCDYPDRYPSSFFRS